MDISGLYRIDDEGGCQVANSRISDPVNVCEGSDSFDTEKAFRNSNSGIPQEFVPVVVS
jgi:hypothetical protein